MPKMISLMTLALALCSSCDRGPEPARVITDPAPPATRPVVEPLPAAPLRAAQITVDFGVYHLSHPKTPPRDLVRSLAARAGLRVLDTMPATAPTAPTIVILTPTVAEAPPADLAELKVRGRGVSDADGKRLQKADSLTVVMLWAPAAEGMRSYRTVLALVLDLARQTDGLVYDATNRAVFSPAELAKLLDGWSGDFPDVTQHITLDTYRHGDLMRIVSLGMQRFGLPDLAVAEVSIHDSGPMNDLVNVILQTMIEGGTIDGTGHLGLSVAGLKNEQLRTRLAAAQLKNGTGRATVRLAPGVRAEGDANNQLLDLEFPGPAGSLQIRHSEMLGRFFGSTDSTTRAKEDDPELNAASTRAKQALAKMKPRFSPRPPDLEHLLVKAPFTTRDGGIEWMWVEVVRWNGRKIEGILENDPDYVDNLKAGARVEVDEASLFDYIWRKRDGKLEGNETGKILAAREKHKP